MMTFTLNFSESPENSFFAPPGPVPLPAFVGGEENLLARWAVENVQSSQMPIVFVGDHGVGKSHLAACVASHWARQNPGGKATIISGADFARRFAEAVETNDIEGFRDQFQDAGFVGIEDIHQLNEKTAAQVELVKTLDTAMESSKAIVASLPSLPSQNPELTRALSSRLSQGLVVPVSQPGLAARIELVKQLAKHYGISALDNAIEAFADHVVGTANEINGQLLLLRALQGDQSDGQPIVLTPDSLKLLTQETEGPTLRYISRTVAEHFQLTLTQIRSVSRRQTIVLARGLAMVLSRELIGLSYGQIGEYFGGRDHSTVMHACRKVEGMLGKDGEILQAYEDIKKKVART
jgi:chromosomal replication initiator protein